VVRGLPTLSRHQLVKVQNRLVQHPPNAVFAAASEADDESSAKGVPVALNQTAAVIRG
jgi:hypothetical protein